VILFNIKKQTILYKKINQHRRCKMSDSSVPIYKLVVDPEYRGDFKEKYEKDVEMMNFALAAIGKAKGFGNNPRWDLLFERGLKALLEK
jgi:hypothetical protein